MKSIILIIIGLFLLVLIATVLLNSSRRRRMQLEKELQFSKGRWQLALEASQEGVWDWDIEKGVVFYSPRWEEIFGFKPGEAPPTQETFTSLVHPDELEEVVEEIRRCLRREIPFYKKEVRMFRRDGTPIWTLRSASVIFDKAGNPVRMIGTTIDITERKNAEAALLQSETRLKLQIERMPIGLIVWTTDFRVISWNPSAESIFGYTAREMLGEHPYGYIVHPEAQSVVDGIWQRLVEGDSTANSINDNMTKDGRIITCKWTNTPIWSENGQVTSVISMIEDITERINAEEMESRRNSEILRHQQILLQLSSLPLNMEFDEKLKQIIPQAARTLSCERVSVWRLEEAAASITTDFVYNLSTDEFLPGLTLHRRDYPGYFSCLNQNAHIVANDAHTHPCTLEFSAGYLTPLNISSMLDIPLQEGDRVAGVICHEHVGPPRIWTENEQGFARSISNIISLALESEKRRKAEEGLIKSQQNFEEAQAIAHVGSWDYDLATGNLVWTKEMFSLFEMENHPPETLYETFRSKIYPDDLAKLDENIQRAIEHGETYEMLERVALRDGSTRYLSCIGEPVKDAAGNIVGLRGTSQNITPHKQAALAKSEFLSTMSHEIRTPINGVIGLVNMLMEENLTDLQREYVNTLNFSAQHLATIVSDILDFSKIEAGNLSLEKVHFNLKEVCENVFKLFKNKAQEKSLEYYFTPASLGNWTLYGDVSRLNQILANLLSNAVKFTEKGKVDFRYTIKEDTPEAVTLLFSIKDTGIGIHELEQEKIFEYFSQANERISRNYGGTGLGLTICKRLVEIQGGKIFVESNAGQGSIFTVELTFEKVIHSADSNAKNSSLTDALSEALPGMKVLVAEDHHINAMVLVHQLEKWQVACTLVNDGKEAVERLEKEQFDVVLMDIWMPNMDGIQALKAIRSMDRESVSQTPVLAFTADASLDSIRGFLENGFDDCITKPFNPKSLFRVLKKYDARPLPFQQLKPDFAALPLEHRQIDPEKSKLFHEVEFVVPADVVTGPKTGV